MRPQEMRVGMTGNGVGYIVAIRDSSATVWTSEKVHLDRHSAKGFAHEIEDRIASLACAWCGERATEIDHFGYLDNDTSDISAFCDDYHCKTARYEESRV